MFPPYGKYLERPGERPSGTLVLSVINPHALVVTVKGDCIHLNFVSFLEQVHE
ncbi:hypothetical protein M413DRAFT_162944 [Hebeloma cylindrosporum]|uniref:Uncharacterized protein n=1 Tax=Hebeloma cylindrosporum TaxID=76867 RepID=A0A0C2YHD6_HEBCY|nr:hypothetical protein M413DRAFT_162944 [Hebeloma cylindrosporum h7]